MFINHTYNIMKKFLVLLVLVAAQATAWAQKPKIVTTDKPGWTKIAETTVDFKTETDELLVIGNNRFDSLKFTVEDAPVSLVSFDIYFDKGGQQSVAVSQDIKSAGESQVVKLTGDTERKVTKVVFRYKTVGSAGNDKKATVKLWGLKS
jgi:hypothetical protein